MLIGIVRFLTTLLSIALLATAVYLLWTWSEGYWVSQPDGDLIHVRDDWRLWAGGALVAWSICGRWMMLLLLARPDERKVRAERENGVMMSGTAGASLYVEEHGPATAPTIIFTHGWGLDSTMWRYAKADLGARFRLIFWDLPGLGKSRRGPGNKIDMRDFANDLASLLSMAKGQVVLVGHSIGGMTIQTLVRDHPDALRRVAGVILLNTTYTNPLKTIVLSGLLQALRRPVLEPTMRLMIVLQPLVWLSQWQSYLNGHAHLAQRLGFGKYVTRSQLDQCALLATRNSPAVQMHGNLAMFRWDATGAMSKLKVPLLVIGGDKDIVTKIEAGRAIAQSNASGRFEVVENVNHMGPMEGAEHYNRLIEEFVLQCIPLPKAIAAVH